MSHAEDWSPADTAGLYRPEEIFWRVNRESVLLLTGARAVIRESGRIGVLLHIPRSHAFADAAEFDAYMGEMTRGGLL